MKKTNILYWIFTGIFAALMLFSAIPDILNTEDAITFMHGQLQYPLYMIPFIGWAKVFGVIGILVPGFPRIKEWAYAGLAIDLVGAIYSMLAIDGFKPPMLGMLVWVVFGVLSYIYYHKKLQTTKQN
ncbi:MAG: DoxX family protein [Bacteroidetes bacterium]|nr:DoxX family protein [Bacteroidota bacterium]